MPACRKGHRGIRIWDGTSSNDRAKISGSISGIPSLDITVLRGAMQFATARLVAMTDGAPDQPICVKSMRAPCRLGTFYISFIAWSKLSIPRPDLFLESFLGWLPSIKPRLISCSFFACNFSYLFFPQLLMIPSIYVSLKKLK